MNLYEKLTALQNELAVPKGRRNGFGKYDYRSAEDILNKVKPLLTKHRLSQTISDEIVCIEERHYVLSSSSLASPVVVIFSVGSSISVTVTFDKT